MKLKNKLILTFIFFAFFVTFNNKKCLALTYTFENISYSYDLPVWGQNIQHKSFSSGNSSFFTQDKHFFIYFDSQINKIVLGVPCFTQDFYDGSFDFNHFYSKRRPNVQNKADFFVLNTSSGSYNRIARRI